MFLPFPQNFQAQIGLGKQLACQADAPLFILHGHLFPAHLAGPVTALSHDLHAAYAATSAPATHRNTLPAKLLHGLENVSFCRTGEFLTTVFNGNYKFYCCRAHREYVCIYDLTIIQNFLNRALRRAGLALSAAVKKFSMKMCSSNSRPRIRLVMLLSIMGGGPHR